MQTDEIKTVHTLTLENRAKLTLTGIDDVDGFNEEEILAVTDYGELTVKGELLHIEELNIESKILVVTGNISQLIYSEAKKNSTVLKRLFGG